MVAVPALLLLAPLAGHLWDVFGRRLFTSCVFVLCILVFGKLWLVARENMQYRQDALALATRMTSVAKSDDTVAAAFSLYYVIKPIFPRFCITWQADCWPKNSSEYQRYS